MELSDQLKRDEALKLRPYLDCCGKYWRDCRCANKGKLTIGVGRNLDDVGISKDEAEYMEANDIAKARLMVGQKLPWSSQLNPARLAVLHNMYFNMGDRLLDFKNTLALIKDGNYEAAAKEMLKSLWAKQTGDRAIRLSEQIRTGEWV